MRKQICRKESGYTVGLFPAHPSQVWILRQLEISLGSEYHFLWFIRDKDISTQLADELSIKYTIVSKAQKGFWGNAFEMIVNVFKLLRFTRLHNIDLWISKYSSAHIVSKFLKKKSIFFIDDDYDLVPNLYNLSCPVADEIILPQMTRSGPYKKKLTRINGLFELVYLHPCRFTPRDSIYTYLGITPKDKYAIIRLAALTAHHDAGIKGVSESLLGRVINLCSRFDIGVFITSEKPVSDTLEKYRLPIPVSKIHHALFYAEFLLGDSQTMTSEAAVLGTPAFRINSFVGRISCIADLEKKKLAFGFKPGEEDRLISTLQSFLENKKRTNHKSLTDNVLKNFDDPLSIFIKTIRGLLQ